MSGPPITIGQLRSATVLTVEQAAHLYGIASSSAAYRAIANGSIPGAFKLGSQWRIRASDVRRHLCIEEANSATED